MTTSGQPHTGSYYAATVNDQTEFPSLAGDRSADVCIIGAGFTGISSALHLAERGYKVCVLEANKVGWGASGRNGGQMIGGISGEATMAKAAGADGAAMFWEMRWAGHEIIRERVQSYGIDCDLKYGYLDVAIKERHRRDLERQMETLQAHRFPHEYRLLSQFETADMLGTESYIGALQNNGNGHLHPLNLCIGEARAAATRGADLYENSAVTHIAHGAKATVHTTAGSVSADFVIIAGNAYHLLEKKLRGLMFPVNSFIIGSEPLPESLVQEINRHDLAVCDPNFVLQYFRLSADKRLLFGGRCNYFGADPEVIKRNLVPRMLKIYPQLRQVNFEFGWGGTIGVPANRVPQIGRVAPNVFYAQGYSGHGVNVTHLTGQVLADAIAGTFERFDLFARIRPLCIPGTALFGRQMVSLGMLYYGLKDRL